MSYMHGGYLSICAEYYEKKKAEKRVSENKGPFYVDEVWLCHYRLGGKPRKLTFEIIQQAVRHKEEKEKAERTVSKDKKLYGDLPHIDPKRWAQFDKAMTYINHKIREPTEEKQMTQSLDEIMEAITPEGMYVYLERNKDKLDYRFHVHTGEGWKTGTIREEMIRSQDWGEIQYRISRASDWRGSFGDEEFPRRCAAQREVLKDTIDNLIAPFTHLEEFSKRMGKSREKDGAIWTIEPHEQMKSVQVLQDMVNEGVSSLRGEIEKLKAPWEEFAWVKGEPAPWVESQPKKVNEEVEKLKAPTPVVKSGLTIGAEIAEEKAREEMCRHVKSVCGVNSVARGQPEAEQDKKCCGNKSGEVNKITYCCGNPKNHVPGGIACWKHI